MKRILTVAVVVAALLACASVAIAGAVGGPKVQRTEVQAFATDVYRVAFHGGELAVVTVIGDGDTDLDLYIYDQFGNLVTFDDGPTDNCVVSWVPRQTGYYTIKVVNRGRVFNRYTIRTN